MNYKKNPDTDFKDIDKLSKKEAKEQASDLREGIDYHDYRYYVKNNPVISDAEYDKLFKRLQEIEEKFPDLKTEDSPTTRIGGKPKDEFEKTEHESKMLSLNAVMEFDEVKDFDERVKKEAEKPEYVLEPKFDGVSVELVYEGGKLKTGSTRGDGTTGEDITANLKTIRAVPLRLRKNKNMPKLLSVRGEVFLPKDAFQEMNKERIERNKNAFANPRNAAAGIVRNLDPSKVKEKPLDIMFYDIIYIEGGQFSKHSDALKEFVNFGLKVIDLNKKVNDLKEIEDYHKKLAEKREELDFEIDGAVIKLNDLKKRKDLGVRERSPRWAVAWKFEPKKEITTLREIAVQVGRTGKLTPVALLDPVDISGVTVSKATLHNEKETRKKDLRPGDRVKLQRAGDVIPEVKERIKEKGKKRADKFTMPDKCPVCGTNIVQENEYHYCPAGLACKAQLKEHIKHFVSKGALDIDGLGEETIDALVENNMLKEVPDLYKFEPDDFKKLDGFKKKASEKLYYSIQRSKKAKLGTFLYALGITHVGNYTARVIARHFNTYNNVKYALKEDFESIDEIGNETAKSIYEFFRKDNNLEIINKLFDLGFEVKEAKEIKEKENIKDKTFVFTGSLDDFTREEAKETVEKYGGKAASSVSGNTDYLVKGKGGKNTNKYNNAEENNVKIIDENEFKKLINE